MSRARRIFAYGTLQFPAIMAAVTGVSRPGRLARLDDYGRYCVRDAPFPGIAPREGGQVAGLVYSRVDADALARIDAFEGALYRRERVLVQADGRPLSAETYIVRPHWRGLLIDADWDADAFARRWHDAYVRACQTERTGDP